MAHREPADHPSWQWAPWHGRPDRGILKTRMKLSAAELQQHDDRPVGDQCVHLSGMFDDYEALLRMRGECAIPRISYREGNIVIVTPSLEHELLKSMIGCLVDVYCMWRGHRFRKFGSWTIKDRRKERGAEPDECYVFGEGEPLRPDLAIEVIWTSAGIDKLEIYRLLEVPEVWMWQRGRITIHGLKGDQYQILAASEVLPGMDLNELVNFLDRPTTYDAAMDYRTFLEASARGTQR